MMELKRGMFVFLRTNMFDRIRIHGWKNAFNRKLATSIGIVLEANGNKFVVEFGKIVKIRRIEDVSNRIVGRSMNNRYRNYSFYDSIRDRAFALYANTDVSKYLSRLHKFPQLSQVYSITAPDIIYPQAFSDFEFDIADLFSGVFGYEQV